MLRGNTLTWGKNSIIEFWTLYCRDHNWNSHKWLSETHVWFEECQDCDAVRISRANDTAVIDEGGQVHILIHHNEKDFSDPEFILRALKESGSDWGRKNIRKNLDIYTLCQK